MEIFQGSSWFRFLSRKFCLQTRTAKMKSTVFCISLIGSSWPPPNTYFCLTLKHWTPVKKDKAKKRGFFFFPSYCLRQPLYKSTFPMGRNLLPCSSSLSALSLCSHTVLKSIPWWVLLSLHPFPCFYCQCHVLTISNRIHNRVHVRVHR